MEFDKSKVYTALNADELKVGSKVIVADNLACLKQIVDSDNQEFVYTIDAILPDDNNYRFKAKDFEWALAYLISEPEKKKLKWTDLKIGDVVRNVHSGRDYLVTGLDKHAAGYNVNLAGTWTATASVEMNFEKVDYALEEYERRVEE